MSDASAVSSGVAAFDALAHHEAATLLEMCCGSTAWVEEMTLRRPFGTLHVLLEMAERVWWSLTPEDWREAFDHHPRIGEQEAQASQSTQARGWSAQEQHGVSAADAGTRQALAEANRAYERRFGYIYLVCATGKSAEEMLASLRQRLTNDPAAELTVAAGEQAKITRLRLEKMFNSPSAMTRE